MEDDLLQNLRMTTGPGSDHHPRRLLRGGAGAVVPVPRLAASVIRRSSNSPGAAATPLGSRGHHSLGPDVPGNLRWPIGPLARVKKFCDTEVVPLLDEELLVGDRPGLLSAGVGEEMLFRGVLQASISSWLGCAWGLVLASLLFGLLHPISLTYMVIACIHWFLSGRGLDRRAATCSPSWSSTPSTTSPRSAISSAFGRWTDADPERR